LIDIAGFDESVIQSPNADDMDSGDLVFGRQGDNAEFFDWFGFQVQDLLEGVVTGFGRGYFILADVVVDGGFFNLFQGVDIDTG
jgi:hypothetical protein